MSKINPDKIALDQKMTSRDLNRMPIELLEKIKREGRVWGDLTKQYGVDNPHPPWQVTLEATCDVLAEDDCALPALERRWEEDELVEQHYADVPFPERQLLALAHTMIRRGLISENELAQQMQTIDTRLHMVDENGETD